MSSGEQGPMHGRVVLDFGVFGSGPKTGLILAWMGAEVIRIESPRFPDQFRGAATLVAEHDGEDVAPWDRSMGVNTNNRGKSHLCLDYTTQEGAGILDGLIARADVVLHNFRMSVADKVGLTWERCSRVNPRVILLAISSQGADGPRRDFSSYGTTLEGLGGVASLIRGEAGPLITGVNFPDQAAPIMASGVVAAALLERDVTGEGMFIDLAQLEATAMLASSAVQAPEAALLPAFQCDERCVRGVLACEGDDTWVALETTEADHVARIRVLVGVDPVTPLEPALRAWARSLDKFEAEEALRAAGIPAAAVRTGIEVLADPVHAWRGYFEYLDDCLIGAGGQNGNPLGHGLGARTRNAARPLGHDNAQVLRDYLGMDESRIADLAAAGVIATRPMVGGAGGQP